MKTKLLILLFAASAFSFTFVTVNHNPKKEIKRIVLKQSHDEPAGGFISEDKP